jgi:hypothetical protein
VTEQGASPEQFLRALARLTKAQEQLAQDTAELRRELRDFRQQLGQIIGQTNAASIVGGIVKEGIARLTGRR